MTKQEKIQLIFEKIKLESISPRDLEVFLQSKEFTPTESRILVVELLDAGKVFLNENLKFALDEEQTKRDQLRQAILEAAKASPLRAKQIREALILKGWDGDSVRRELAWLWDHGYISVTNKQLIHFNCDYLK